jgi:hypothetical protein
LYELGEQLKMNEEVDEDQKRFVQEKGDYWKAVSNRRIGGISSSQALRTELKVYGCSQLRRNCESGLPALLYSWTDTSSSRAIFEEFEPYPSDDEDYSDDDAETSEGDTSLDIDSPETSPRRSLGKARNTGKERAEDGEDDEEGTGVMTSQLRHFLIQVSLIRCLACNDLTSVV